MVSGTRRQTDFVELELQEQPRYRGEKPPTRPAPPPDRNNRPPLPAATPTPQPPFEIEDLRAGAQSYPQQSLRRQQRDMVTGGAIDLDEVARPEVLDPRA
jgi:hypothetical protein